MRLSILVVDDDLATRLAISDYLEALGYAAIAANNGQEALSLLVQYQPQLIVADILMPEMDGYELVRRVRQKPEFRLLPVIFLSARTKTEERIRGYELGCDIYLPKPFDLEELGVVVRSLLERYTLMSQASQMAHLEEGHSPSTTHVATGQSHESESGEGSQREAISPSQSVNGSLENGCHLSDRERQVLALLVEGLSNPQIGDRLYLSPRTIEKYVSSLLRKTNTSKRAELVRFALQQHLID
ncbi:DNA-binding response regulator [Geitlerinema sp. PCC 9228]|jgi:DNA-binding NarL/FixJ family response regulator|uniref:response regulator transcription factor n=1 Tax=Geitlerinema sp. PCC 9228 TaxID=111611 RepID=UPI0008F98F5E|nr:DNA-binding response regulator [Geitlerinema sp. PCC 9228]